jgi:hypothetical protein
MLAMRQPVPAFLAVLLCAILSMLALAGCGHGGSPATSTDRPLSQVSPATNTDRPLSQVSASAALPKSTRPPGPAITSACRELDRAQVAAALGVPTVTAEERPGSNQPGGSSSYACGYLGGGPHLDLDISTELASRTPQLAVDLVIRQYTGVLQNVPGLGDAATFTGPSAPGADPAWQTLVTSRIEGSQMRTVILSTFSSGQAKGKLIALARSVLARI